MLLLILLVLLDWVILIEVGISIGAITTLLIVLLTGMGGVFLIRLSGFTLFFEIQKLLHQGEGVLSSVFSSFCMLLAGILLVIPGYITDILGLLLLIPYVQKYVGKYFFKQFYGKKSTHRIIDVSSSNSHTSHKE